MNLIRTAIDRPSAVVSIVLMAIMFGLIALDTIPIQLTPDISKPVITVETYWGGAAPAEIEREITIRQEEVLKGINGLSEITSESQPGRARVRLEFDVSTNMDRALLLVSNRLDQVTGYPDEASEPTLKTAGAEDSPIAWFVVNRLKDNTRPIHEYGDFITNVIKDRIERVKGVGGVNIFGGSDREIEVVIKPEELARYRLTVSDVVSSLRAANAAISAGDVDEGKRRYVIRTEGELNTLDKIRAVVLRSVRDETNGRLGRVTVNDIAKVNFSYKEPAAKIRFLGQSSIAFNAQRETGANVIETMAGIKAAVAELNERVIPEAGLKLQHIYDETVYINSSVSLVQQNIVVGGALAIFILVLFLRSWRATLIVSIAIPVSIIGSFVAMAALGRSLNVISLAGLAFAVGMVVDAAIVVLENIYRLREQGKPAHIAAYEGASQVWGAVFVSALTTVMVFIPVLITPLEVGQLFRDIAVAVSVSVLLSLLVSITVLPAMANWLLGASDKKKANGNGNGRIRKIKLPVIDHFASGFVNFVVGFTRFVTRRKSTALLVVTVVSMVATWSAWVLLPKLEYLPEGNRNLMFGFVIPPPGYNLKTTEDIAQRIESEVRPLWASETGSESKPGEPPKIQRFFFVAMRSATFIGAAAVDPSRAAELKPVLQKPVFKEPGTFASINQVSLFGRGLAGGRKIELDIVGSDLEEILKVAGRAAGKVLRVLPMSEGNQFRPQPGLELGAPEVRVIPNRLLLADNGISALELGRSIDAFNSGLRVAEITVGNTRLDLMLKGQVDKLPSTQGVGNLPVVTRGGQILPVSSVAEVQLTSGPTEIRHRERQRAVTLIITPSPKLALEQALNVVNEKVVAVLQKEGMPAGVKLQIAGTAGKLKVTRDAMARDLIVAIVIVYLVMAILFESFVFPLIILLSVPIAAAGGVAGLALLNTYIHQPLDMLTLLGFVILIGIVVNNAILLVHQTLHHLRNDNMSVDEAITEATRNRIRPIFMSTLTSVFGMLPLVVFPGAGSELYRGLGSVVLGGLSLSAILTLLIVPPMLSLFVRAETKSKTAISSDQVTA
ncbi:MAG: efflux RND transporter permease subunit [Methyloligellaceae bacterium]